MKKFLVCFTLFAFLLPGVVEAGTEYQLGNGGTPDTGFKTEGNSISRRALRFAVANDGSSLIVSDRSLGSQGVYAYASTNFFATYTRKTDLFNYDVADQTAVIAIGDTILVGGANDAIAGGVNLAKYVNGVYSTTQVLLAAGNSPGLSNGNRLGLGAFLGTSNEHLILADTNNSTNCRLWRATGTWGSLTRVLELENTRLGGGLRLPVNNITGIDAGYFIWDNNGATGTGPNARFTDTAGSYLLNSSISSTDFTTVGYGYSWATVTQDTFVQVAYQSTTSSGNGLWFRPGVIGTPTGVSPSTFVLGTAVQIVAAGVLPDNFAAFPTFCALNKDSIWATFRQPNGANIDVMMTFTGDGGLTWATPWVEIAGSSASRRYVSIQMPPKAYRDVALSVIWHPMTYCDSTTNNATEYTYVYSDSTIYGGGGDPEPEPSTKNWLPIIWNYTDPEPGLSPFQWSNYQFIHNRGTELYSR